MHPDPSAAPSTLLAARVLAREPKAVARALSVVEAGGPAADSLLSAVHPFTGHASVIGITGPPGAGKSTLVGQLTARYRAAGFRVGVLAVDPSSPFSGGALLGDRVRMHAHALDTDVFIRSMASRGHAGGLAVTTVDAADVLDAAGFDIVLIETVGVGQDEVDVVRVVDVCVVTLVPGAGDEVQAMKAGIMEIADLFVVNKADLAGAEHVVGAIEQSLGLDERSGSRRPPVLRVVATTGQGLDALVVALDAARGDGAARDRRRSIRAEWRLCLAIAHAAVARVKQDVETTGRWQDIVADITARRIAPHTAAADLVAQMGACDIDHIGVATDAIDTSLAVFRDVLGLSVGASEEVSSQGVRVRFVGVGHARIELIEAADQAAPFARALRERGPGLHHVAIRVRDLEATLRRLESAGVRLIDKVGRPGAHGAIVAFVHPSAARGVLVELVQRQDLT